MLISAWYPKRHCQWKNGHLITSGHASQPGSPPECLSSFGCPIFSEEGSLRTLETHRSMARKPSARAMRKTTLSEVPALAAMPTWRRQRGGGGGLVLGKKNHQKAWSGGKRPSPVSGHRLLTSVLIAGHESNAGLPFGHDQRFKSTWEEPNKILPKPEGNLRATMPLSVIPKKSLKKYRRTVGWPALERKAE